MEKAWHNPIPRTWCPGRTTIDVANTDYSGTRKTTSQRSNRDVMHAWNQEKGGAWDNKMETNQSAASNKSSSSMSSVTWNTGDPAELDSNDDAPRLQSRELLDLPTPSITRPNSPRTLARTATAAAAAAAKAAAAAAARESDPRSVRGGAHVSFKGQPPPREPEVTTAAEAAAEGAEAAAVRVTYARSDLTGVARLNAVTARYRSQSFGGTSCNGPTSIFS